jgi:hypothetical protein
LSGLNPLWGVLKRPIVAVPRVVFYCRAAPSEWIIRDEVAGFAGLELLADEDGRVLVFRDEHHFVARCRREEYLAAGHVAVDGRNRLAVEPYVDGVASGDLGHQRRPGVGRVETYSRILCRCDTWVGDAE